MRRNAFACLLLLTGCASDVRVLSAVRDAGSSGADSAAADHDATMPNDAALPDDASQPLPPATTELGSAFDHTCAVVNGDVYCWGANVEGQLGVGDREPRTRPVRVSLPTRAFDTCVGEAHSCALGSDGHVYCWGKNLHGQLGVGDFQDRLEPARITQGGFGRIACGGTGTCGLRSEGALFCWGDNEEGKIGQGDPFGSEDIPVPTEVRPGTPFRDVSVGQGHVCAVARNGALYCWGRNTDAQLGLGISDAQIRTPMRVGNEADYRAVAASMQHSCALRAGGTLVCWGTDQDGSLGLGVANGARQETPMQVAGDMRYRAVSTNWFHTCALGEDNTLHCFGRNVEGQLGLGDTDARNVPTRVGSESDWLDLAAGHFHTCGIARARGLLCWGKNDEFFELGLGAEGRRHEPTPVPLP